MNTQHKENKMNAPVNWFCSKYSNADLAQILSDYSREVHGFRMYLNNPGRCSLVDALEKLDAIAN